MSQVRTCKRGKTFSCIFAAGKINGRRKVVEKGGFVTKSAKGVAERLGHADATITQNLYTHNTEKLQE